MRDACAPPNFHGEHRLRQVGRDGWTAVTADGSSAAQFEHAVVLTGHTRTGAEMRDPHETKRNARRSRLTVGTDRMVELVDCVVSLVGVLKDAGSPGGRDCNGRFG